MGKGLGEEDNRQESSMRFGFSEGDQVKFTKKQKASLQISSS
jgi:hypothetical protein